MVHVAVPHIPSPEIGTDEVSAGTQVRQEPARRNQPIILFVPVEGGL